MTPLTDVELQVLELEGRFWKQAGAKEQAARELLDLSPVRYHQLLNRLLDVEAAEAHSPLLVHRLRRVRDRHVRRLGPSALRPGWQEAVDRTG